MDYRKLKAMVVRNTYPIYSMDECQHSVEDATVFATLDCNSGYRKIPVAEEDMPKTTFTGHVGTYAFRRMQFGLMNAPATIQRMPDIFLSEYRWKCCPIHSHDIIIFSEDVASHIQDVAKFYLCSETPDFH